MKLKNIIIGGLGVIALTACNDFLDVPAPSGYTQDVVFGSSTEANTALNGVYAKALVNNAFGNNVYNALLLNSDVDFTANSNEQAQANTPRRFDMRPDGSATKSFWDAMYAGVEEANEFICGLQESSIYSEKEGVTDLTQMMGEAKVLRAMFYHELLSYYGDIPFTLESTYKSDNLLPPVTKRQEVSDALIKDLQDAQLLMKSTTKITEGAERISKEACQAMIARLALQAGGYSLNHDEGDATGYKMTRPANYKDYYKVASAYCDSVMQSKNYTLTKNYRDVFVDQCNYIVNINDDVIFEFPFAKETTSNFGYMQGPTASDNGGETAGHDWGKCDGSVRTTAFYRYQFEEGDARRDYVCGMWYYTNEGLPTMRFDYAMHNNKWSKLWNKIPTGKTSTGSTGINFAYLRYADVLLMYAEAQNELNNGPNEDARKAVLEVRERAFRGSGVDYTAKVNAALSQEAFLKVVLDERKYEFAGENMRWKDLVRNNMYSEALFYTFLLYQGMAENSGGTAQYLDLVEQHDGILYSEKIPAQVYSCPVKNMGQLPNFPNNQLYLRYIVNPYTPGQMPQVAPNNYDVQVGVDEAGKPILVKDIAVADRTITGLSSSSTTIQWTETNTMDWWNQDGYPKDQVLYSLFGYIRGTKTNEIIMVDNGQEKKIIPTSMDVNNLPAVRYLLPYPQEVIARSSGAYKNYYGYK